MKIHSLKVTGTSNAASENEVQHEKTAVEIESDLITHYKNRFKIDDFPIPDPFKISHGRMEEDEGMVACSYRVTYAFQSESTLIVA